MLNVYCRFICHHELNCDLFLSFRSPLHAVSCSWVCLFSLETRYTPNGKDKQNPCRKKQQHLMRSIEQKRFGSTREFIWEMNAAKYRWNWGVRCGSEWVSEQMQRHAIILKSHSVDIKSGFGSSLGPLHSIEIERWSRLNTKINIIQRLVETDEIRIAGPCARLARWCGDRIGFHLIWVKLNMKLDSNISTSILVSQPCKIMTANVKRVCVYRIPMCLYIPYCNWKWHQQRRLQQRRRRRRWWW